MVYYYETKKGYGYMSPALQKEIEAITFKEYESLPSDERVEVFDGFVYIMARPSIIHQTISM